MPDLFTTEEVERSLEGLEGWELEGKVIAREFEFETFLAGIAFVVTVATAAEELNHHPDIDIRYRRGAGGGFDAQRRRSDGVGLFAGGPLQ